MFLFTGSIPDIKLSAECSVSELICGMHYIIINKLIYIIKYVYTRLHAWELYTN